MHSVFIDPVSIFELYICSSLVSLTKTAREKPGAVLLALAGVEGGSIEGADTDG